MSYNFSNSGEKCPGQDLKPGLWLKCECSPTKLSWANPADTIHSDESNIYWSSFA